MDCNRHGSDCLSPRTNRSSMIGMIQVRLKPGRGVFVRRFPVGMSPTRGHIHGQHVAHGQPLFPTGRTARLPRRSVVQCHSAPLRPDQRPAEPRIASALETATGAPRRDRPGPNRARRLLRHRGHRVRLEPRRCPGVSGGFQRADAGRSHPQEGGGWRNARRPGGPRFRPRRRAAAAGSGSHGGRGHHRVWFAQPRGSGPGFARVPSRHAARGQTAGPGFREARRGGMAGPLLRLLAARGPTFRQDSFAAMPRATVTSSIHSNNTRPRPGSADC